MFKLGIGLSINGGSSQRTAVKLNGTIAVFLLHNLRLSQQASFAHSFLVIPRISEQKRDDALQSVFRSKIRGTKERLITV